MTSSPFDGTHDQTTSGVVCHHRPWIAKHIQTISGVACHHLPWIAKYDSTTSGVACHHGHWAIYTVRRHQPWQCHHRPWNDPRSDDFKRGMPSSSLERYMIKQRLAWDKIISFRKHTQLDDVRHVMSAWILGSTHDRMTLGIACYHHHSAPQAVE